MWVYGTHIRVSNIGLKSMEAKKKIYFYHLREECYTFLSSYYFVKPIVGNTFIVWFCLFIVLYVK